MSKIKFHLNRVSVTESQKNLWERGDIPEISFDQYDIVDGDIDDMEKYMIDFIRKSFSDIKDNLHINSFSDAFIVMPSLQMCSDDDIDVIDMNIDINTYSEYTQEDELNSENVEDDSMDENIEEYQQNDDDDDDDDDVPIGVNFWNSKYVEEVYQDPHDEEEIELDDKSNEFNLINNDDDYYKKIEDNYVESINNFYDENIADKSEVESYDNPTEDEISEMEMDIIRKSLLGDEDM